MTNKVLYILYNADASVMGKLRYSYRKITGPKDCDAECAACELTHGGLSLKETPSWLEAKTEIENSSDIKVVQWHRDELSSQVIILFTAWTIQVEGLKNTKMENRSNRMSRSTGLRTQSHC